MQTRTINFAQLIQRYSNSFLVVLIHSNQQFVVPAVISDDDLVSIAEFRSKGRVPTLSWQHPHNGSSLSRCAQVRQLQLLLILTWLVCQPRTGITRTRCTPDENLVNAIKKLNQNSKTLYLVDSRPVANALANVVMGRGMENPDLYPGCKMKFLSIGNIRMYLLGLSRS